MKKALLLFITWCIGCSLQAQLYLPKKLKGKAGKYFEDMQYVMGDTLFNSRKPGLPPLSKPTVKAVIKEFYLCRYETSNSEWLSYCRHVKRNKGYVAELKCRPDSNCWYEAWKFAGPETHFLHDSYFLHPGFAKYPVVGVSHAKVLNFINWKNEQADSVLKAAGITKYKVVFRLPTSNEFEFISQNVYNRHYGLLGIRGGYLANFGSITDSTGYVFKRAEDDGWETTARVDAYSPNDLGLWNIKGNVEEWVSDTYKGFSRNTSYDKFLSIDSTETDSVVHICMGGSWIDPPGYLAPGFSKAYPPGSSSAFSGFRLAMDVVEVKPAAGK